METAGIEASEVSTRPDAGPGRGYRPHLDGLRAVAVYLVVIFHAGAYRFLGGFIGVDVFFVLSGYLVTQLLMRDLVGGGSIRFVRFYARRMRRLLPASAVLLLVTAVVYSAIASPADVVNAVGSFKAAFLYVANWYFIHQSSDYFATNVSTSPVVHFWSLAIEEQFYLVWPVLLGGLFVATRSAGVAGPPGDAGDGGRSGTRVGVVGAQPVEHEREPRVLRHGRPGVSAAGRRTPGVEPRADSPGGAAGPNRFGRSPRARCWRWCCWHHPRSTCQ